MKMDKKTIIAIVLGIVAVGVVLYQAMGAFPSTSNIVSSAIATPTPSPIVSQTQNAAASDHPESPLQLSEYDILIATLKEVDLPYESKQFRNPMRPLVSEGKGKKRKTSGPASKVDLKMTSALSLGYTIEGIVWNDTEPLALVNDQVVGVGDTLDDGALVASIMPDTVKFTKNGKEYFLVFKED